MRSLDSYVNEDTNQFGPGTDLVVALLALFLVLTLVTAYVYRQESIKRAEYARLYEGERARNEKYEREKAEAARAAAVGNFRLASSSFPAGDFYASPVTKLVHPAQTDATVKTIVQDYAQSSAEFPFIFVIGHSNELDDPTARDRSRLARLQRNWDYAARRAELIAALIQQYLTADQRDRLVVMTTGEFDLREPTQPHSQENAWVEVVFGRAWKPPSHGRRP